MNITINGSRVEVDGAPLTYERVVSLAEHNPARVLSVVYDWRGPGDLSRQGSLIRGRQVEPAEGMHFTVADTSNA